MNKVTYLTLIGIATLNYLPLNPLGDKGRDISLSLFLIIYILGRFNLKTIKDKINTQNNKKLIYLTFILLVTSSFYPTIEYNQSFFSTLLAQRYNLTFLFFLELLRIQPSENDLYRAFKLLSILSAISILLVLKYPLLYADQARLTYLISQQAVGMTTDIAVTYPGSFSILIFFFLVANKLIKTHELKYFVLTCLVFTLLLVYQNRSSILIAAPLMAYIALTAKYKYKIFFLTIGSIIVAYVGYSIVSSLYDETIDQLGNDKYNRWQAIDFFIYEFPQNIYTFLFGHGVPCAGSRYLAKLLYAQEYRNAFITDIGLLGTFFYFGILTVSIFYRYIYIGLTTKRVPIAFKFWYLGMIYTPWIQCWGIGVGNVVTCLAFYLIVYYKYQAGSQRIICRSIK